MSLKFNNLQLLFSGLRTFYHDIGHEIEEN